MSEAIQVENQSWDLGEIYTTSSDFVADYERLRGEVDTFDRWRGKLGKSPSILADALEATSDFSRRLGRAHTYAMLRADLDMRAGEREAHRQQIDLLQTRFSVNLSWMRPELLALPKATLEAFLETEPRLEPHAFYLRDLLRLKAHVLGPHGDSGLIRAVKEDGGQLFSEYANEATITIDPADDGSDVSVTMRRTRMTASAGRSSAGMTMTRDAQEDLSALSAACVS